MDFSRNIIFITCLLSGICYSNAIVPGSHFFAHPAGPLRGQAYTRLAPIAIAPTNEEFLEKYAEELICGKNGWAASFRNPRAAPLVNPCGPDKGTCKLIDFKTDYECECIPGYKFNDLYHGANPRTCIKSKSLVTCEPGTRRVAAEKLIVGKLEAGHEWASGTYERVAGEGYPNQNLLRNIHQGTPVNTQPAYPSGTPRFPGGTSLQQYRHDVPINGREYYVQYKVDNATCALSQSTNLEKIPTASLSYDYTLNQWQFKDLRPTQSLTAPFLAAGEYASTLRVYSRDTVKCVEDVQEWFYTYTSSNRQNIGTVFVPKVAAATPTAVAAFQIRDIEALDSTVLGSTVLGLIRDEVEVFKGQGDPATSPLKCPAGSYLRS